MGFLQEAISALGKGNLAARGVLDSSDLSLAAARTGSAGFLTAVVVVQQEVVALAGNLLFCVLKGKVGGVAIGIGLISHNLRVCCGVLTKIGHSSSGGRERK